MRKPTHKTAHAHAYAVAATAAADAASIMYRDARLAATAAMTYAVACEAYDRYMTAAEEAKRAMNSAR